jgi:ABC-type branched-subunit amino acid transport system substrate-binding protein
MPKKNSTALRTFAIFVAGALIGALSVAELAPNYRAAGNRQAADGSINEGGIGNGPSSATSPEALASATATSGLGSLAARNAGLACAPGRNGGATDQGVTGNSIKLATTVVESGIGRSFLRDVRFAMEAVRVKVNQAGGICGRRIEIRYIDDGWEAQKGSTYLRNLINSKVFAIPIGPSSEGLNVVIKSGDFDKARIPVVGTDGMLTLQYAKPGGGAQPWVWPVAAATVASARIMALQAYNSGIKKFSIVFDKNYKFGQEGALAFNAQVKRLTGSNIPGFDPGLNGCKESFCGIVAGQSSYPEVGQFKPGEFVALFLEPQTAQTWMNDPNVRSATELRYGAAQPLFTRSFATSCQRKCDQMMVWTGFKPYIESYLNDPAVREYKRDLERVSTQADYTNAFAEGAYLGMQLLVEAIKRVGPNLTRQALKQVLDTMDLQAGLALQGRLLYTPSNRFVNTTMQGFVIQNKGTFSGWTEGPIVADPKPRAGTS